MNKYNESIFRIIIYDEGGGLKSEERWDEWNKKFRDKARLPFVNFLLEEVIRNKWESQRNVNTVIFIMMLTLSTPF